MQIEFTKAENVLVAMPLERRIDASTAADFKTKLIQWISNGHTRIVLDLSQVHFIDSSGLSAILSALKTIGNQGDLVICSVQESLMNLFNLTRMNRIFRFFSSRDESIQALAK